MKGFDLEYSRGFKMHQNEEIWASYDSANKSAKGIEIQFIVRGASTIRVTHPPAGIFALKTSSTSF